MRAMEVEFQKFFENVGAVNDESAKLKALKFLGKKGASTEKHIIECDLDKEFIEALELRKLPTLQAKRYWTAKRTGADPPEALDGHGISEFEEFLTLPDVKGTDAEKAATTSFLAKVGATRPSDIANFELTEEFIAALGLKVVPAKHARDYFGGLKTQKPSAGEGPYVAPQPAPAPAFGLQNISTSAVTSLAPATADRLQEAALVALIVAMASARFNKKNVDNGNVAFINEVMQELAKYPDLTALMVRADPASEDFAGLTDRYLGEVMDAIQAADKMGYLLSFLTPDYGEDTGEPTCSYKEVQAIDRFARGNRSIIAVWIEGEDADWPPNPGEPKGLGQNMRVFSARIRIDARVGQSPGRDAKLVAGEIFKAMQRERS